MMVESVTFAEAIRKALMDVMASDPSVICYGLGVPDPKGVFGTTLGLQEEFGCERVFDMPTSENAMTGVAIGAALGGIRPVMTHQRMDFFLLAMDQLVNNAAKWSYMFGGQASVPITIRLILGRGWGQGPTHAQNLHAWLAHVPGLKVVMPCTPADAYDLLSESIKDPNPVVFLEHRWLHQQEGIMSASRERAMLGKARIAKEGTDVTLIGSAYMVVEALHAAEWLSKQGVDCEVLDLCTVKPMDWQAIEKSVKKTGRLVAMDTGNPVCSVSSEVITHVAMNYWDVMEEPPARLALPDVPSPASPALTEEYYPGATEIVEAVLRLLKMPNVELKSESLARQPHDVPGDWFNGPF